MPAALFAQFGAQREVSPGHGWHPRLNLSSSPLPLPRPLFNSPERGLEIGTHLPEVAVERSRPRDNDIVICRVRSARCDLGDRRLQPPSHTVSLHRIAHFLGDREPKSRFGIIGWCSRSPLAFHEEGRARPALAAAHSQKVLTSLKCGEAHSEPVVRYELAGYSSLAKFPYDRLAPIRQG